MPEYDWLRENGLLDASSKEIRVLILHLFELTLSTHSSRPARKLCLNFVSKGLKTHGELISQAVLDCIDKHRQTKSRTIAASQAFVSLEWINLCLSAAPYCSTISRQLLVALADLLDTCTSVGVRHSIRRSALRRTRNHIKNILQDPDTAAEVCLDCFTVLTKSSATYKNAPLLGLYIREIVRSPVLSRVSTEIKSMVLDFYSVEFLATKKKIQHSTCTALAPFFASMIEERDLTENLIPGVLKAILRAPELVMAPVVSSLIESISPTSHDVSELLVHSLLPSLLTVLRSSMESTRQDGFSAFTALAHRAGAPTSLISTALFTAFKTDRPGPEQRMYLAKAFHSIQSSSQQALAGRPALLELLARESHEQAQLILIDSIIKGLENELVMAASDTTLQHTILRGVTDKKVSLKNRWLCGLARIGMLDPASSSRFLNDILEPLLSIWQADVRIPIQSMQIASASGTLALTTILLEMGPHSTVIKPRLDALHFRSQIYNKDKPFFPLNQRFISRITPEDDLSWYTGLLKTMVEQSDNDEWSIIASSWCRICLFLPMQSSIRCSLSCVSSRSKQKVLSESLITVINTEVWERDAVVGDNNGIQKFLQGGIVAAFSGAQGASDDSFLDDLLMSAMLSGHHPCFGERMFWIETCQQAGRDPHSLMEQRKSTIVQQSLDTIIDSRQSQVSQKALAAFRVITTLAFVAPSSITLVVEQILRDLLCPTLLPQSETIGIWHTPEGQIFTDVLSLSTGKPFIDKNVKEWKVTEWEASVRERQAKKTGQSTKLTTEQQKKLDKQLEKEDILRKQLHFEVQRLNRGLSLINSINQAYIDAQTWFTPVLEGLLGPILTNSPPFVGLRVQEVFLSCSSRVTCLGAESRIVGLAILQVRTHENPEKTLELVNRVLYKLRFESERKPFDLVSFIYAQKLIDEVLGSVEPSKLGHSGCVTDDQLDEQLFLALEFINHNIAIFSELGLNRLSTINGLISVLRYRPSQAATVRPLVHNICSAMASSIRETEIRFISQYFSSENANVRSALLAAADSLDLSTLLFSDDLWLAMHDEAELNAELARNLFEANDLKVPDNIRTITMSFLLSKSSFVRSCACKALAATFDLDETGMSQLLNDLYTMYREAATEAPTEYDRFGQPLHRQFSRLDATSEARQAIFIAIGVLSTLPEFMTEHAESVATFLFASFGDDSVPAADPSSNVRKAILDTGNSVIAQHGETSVESLLPHLENGLDHHGDTKEADWIRETAVILYGAAASYLQTNDERVPQVVDRLLQTLSTPSETVQIAIASCLPSLVRYARANQDEYIHRMLCLLSDGKSYAERRGAAYGLAGVVKGCGISILHSGQVMQALEQAIHNKKNTKARQGALLAFECFASILGSLWEPYIQSIIPLMLLTFADTDLEVRSATQNTARVIMAHISGFAVQSILPSLLSGLNDHQWRSKKGSVELIGAMAYCAPKQLSTSLPTIIPLLNEVLTDSHAQVRSAGNESLTRFGQVIKNPEIQQLVPALLKALSDPNKYTNEALDKLLKTSFLHYIDSPSLSILIPIIERGMQERIASTKKKSSKIFGLLASLTSPNDLVPHLPSLMPCLRVVLVDTVPDVRATAAKALGSLVEKLGERNFPNLVDELLGSLNSDVASTDRQGAAQGLSEVLAGLGIERLEETLPIILKDARSSQAHVREGFISLLIYLPATFGSRFAPYLAKSISPILKGLADDSEFVRDASLRAGKIMIANYATKSVDLMLPELERGMFNDSWRIRVSSLQLVGDLLFKISGIALKSKADLDDDDDQDVATEAQRSALLQTLGQNRRDRILSSLYIARSDAFALVRSSAINVWKTLVANTPKTLKEILPTLIEILIQHLSVHNSNKRVVYVETLGELVRKLGRDLLTYLLPAFEEGLRSSVADRIGVCVAITEILRSATPDQIAELEGRLVTIVKAVLIDPEEDVRTAANQTFESLQDQFGPKVIDHVLPDLLGYLRSDEKAEAALEALKGLMQSRAHTILPILLPGLLVRPMTSFNLQAISSLVQVAGSALTRRVPELLKVVLDAEVEDEATQEASRTFDVVLLSLTDNAESVATAMNVLLDLCKHANHQKRAKTCLHLAVLFSQSHLDYSRYVSDWIRILISLMGDRSPDVVQGAWTAQDALTKSLRKEEMVQLVMHLRRALQDTCVAGTNLAGFSLPKGLSAVLPILLQSLLYGNVEQREAAAGGLADVLQRTDDSSLKVYVTQITGPLIRIIGERSAPEVKSAILTTLRLLLQKIPQSLKPFLPQLQRTFTKSLGDSSSDVRSKAASALGDLITLQTTRIDPLVTELLTGSRHNESSTSSAMLTALFEVIAKAGSVMSEASKSSVIDLVRDLSGAQDSDKAADLLGVLFRTLTSGSQAKDLLNNVVLLDVPTEFSVNALNGLLLNSAQKISDIHASGDVAEHLSTSILSREVLIAERAIAAAGKFLLNEELAEDFANNSRLILALTRCIEECPSTSSDSRRLSLIIIKAVSKRNHNLRAHQKEVGLAVFSCVRSTILPVRLAAESAFVSVFSMAELQDELLAPFLASLDPVKSRSIGEYAKRVATKVANAENERHAAGISERDDDIEEIMGGSHSIET